MACQTRADRRWIGRGVLALAVVSALTAALASWATDVPTGQLVSAFGSGGVVSGGTGSVEGIGVVRLPSGDLVVATQLGSKLELLRTTSTGQPVPGFGGGGGVAIIDLPSGFAPHGVAADDQGRILVAGTAPNPKSGDSGNPFSRGMVVRLRADGGGLDSFGSGGAAVLESCGTASACSIDLYSLAVRPDGTIVVAGFGNERSTPMRDGMLAAVLAADGGAVRSLGFTGTTDASGPQIARDLTLLPGGAFLTAGTTNQGFFIARHEADAKVDATWRNGKGPLTSSFEPGTSELVGVAVDAAGAVYAAGTATDQARQALLVKLAADGTPAPGFGTNASPGVVFAVPGAADPVVAGVEVGSDGLPVVAGSAAVGGAGRGWLARRRVADGSPDPRFGGPNGVVVLPSSVRGVDGVTLTPGYEAIAGTSTAGTGAPAMVDVSLDAAPKPALSATPARVSVGQPVVLDASASGDVDGTVAAYAFAPDGGSPEPPSTSPLRTVTYAAPTTVAAAVDVVDDQGQHARAAVPIVVTGQGGTEQPLSREGPRGPAVADVAFTRFLPTSFTKDQLSTVVDRFVPPDSTPRVSLELADPLAPDPTSTVILRGKVDWPAGTAGSVCLRKGRASTRFISRQADGYANLIGPGGGGRLAGVRASVLTRADTTLTDVLVRYAGGCLPVTKRDLGACNNNPLSPDRGSCYALSRIEANVGRLPRGPHAYTLEATAPDGKAASASTTFVVGEEGNVRLRALEITQGVQLAQTASLRSDAPERSADYDGVPLATGKTTVVRLYGSVIGLPAGAATVHGTEIPARLFGSVRVGGRFQPLPGSPLAPQWVTEPVGVTSAAGLVALERADPNGAWTFQLPDSWTGPGVHSFTAVLNPSDVEPRRFREGNVLQDADNTIVVRNADFAAPAAMRVFAVGTHVTAGKAGRFDLISPTPQPDWSYLANLLPGPFIPPPPNPAISVDITAQANCLGATDPAVVKACPATDATGLGDVISLNTGAVGFPSTPGNAVGIAIMPSGFRGVTTRRCCDARGVTRPWAVGRSNRPVLSIAHEVFHAVGFAHASPAHGAAEGGSVAQWPPDNEGLNGGFPVDLRPAAPGGVPWTPVTDPGTLRCDTGCTAAADGCASPCEIAGSACPAMRTCTTICQASPHDLMSYCGAGGTPYEGSWISPRNWTAYQRGEDNLDVDGTPFHLATPWTLFTKRALAARLAAAPSEVLQVDATLAADRVDAFNVVRLEGLGPSRPAAASRVHVVTRSASGAVVEDRAVATAPVPDATRPSLSISTRVAARGVARVEVVVDDVVVAALDRSAHRPTVVLLAPKGGTRLDGRRPVAVRWRQGDADGGPLHALVQFSADGGRTWRTVAASDHGGGTAVPGSAFRHTRTGRGRIRVVVDDGFSSATAVSRALTAAGPGPSLRILAPRGGERVPAGAALHLEAIGYDERGRPLGPRAVRWTDGRSRLLDVGTGDLTTLRPGLHRLRAIVHSGGRSRSLTVRVRILPSHPVFEGLQVPKRLAPRSRTLVLATGASVSGTLSVAGYHHRVDRSPSVLRVKIRPGRRPLRLRLTLRTPAGTVRTTRVVRRR